MRSSGTVAPERCPYGDGEGVEACRVFRSELFDLAEEER